MTVDRHRKAVADEKKIQEQALARITETHQKAKAAQEKLDRYCKAQDDIRTEIDGWNKALTPDETVERQVIELQKELEAKIQALWKKHNDTNDVIHQKIKAAEARINESQKFIDEARAEVPEVLEGDTNVREALDNLAKQSSEIDLMEKDLQVFAQNKKQTDMIAEMEAEYLRANHFAESLGQVVGALAGKIKADLMSKAEMPIAGLEYVDGEFKIDGANVDNLSSSKALKLAIGVSRKLAKKTKIICIDGAELLDGETWQQLKTEIEGDGFTYFVTKVGLPFVGDDTVIPMKDGQVVQ